MVRALYSLPIYEQQYAVLYKRCTLRFPEIVDILSKLEYVPHTQPPSTSFNHRAPSPPFQQSHPHPTVAAPSPLTSVHLVQPPTLILSTLSCLLALVITEACLVHASPCRVPSRPTVSPTTNRARFSFATPSAHH